MRSPTADIWLAVVTVVFNDTDALELTAQSVAQQDTSVLEHLIIDGASTDGTAEKAAAMAHTYPWLRVVSEPDTGIYNAMNKGIRHSRGSHVLFLNAGDDFCDADAVRQVHDDWQEHRYQWGRYLVQMVDDQREPTRTVDTAALDIKRFDRADQDPHHQGAIMSRQLLVDLGGFDERYRIVADYELMRRAVLAGYRPWESHRVLTCVDASGLSSTDWQSSIREVHAVRTAGMGGLARLAATGTSARRWATVGMRRAAKRVGHATVGSDRVNQLRGLTAEAKD